eukprot:scaffold37791_cov54-Phaeocystis_antarctica.AAC.2
MARLRCHEAARATKASSSSLIKRPLTLTGELGARTPLGKTADGLLARKPEINTDDWRLDALPSH